jgi:uncharacterized repeat protein (TIGR01451 family)
MGTKRRSRLWVALSFVGVALHPVVTSAQTSPFRVMVTRLVQNTGIEADVSFGDFYADVEVDGMRDTNETACSDVDLVGGIIFPVVLFDGFDAVEACSRSSNPQKSAPWIFDFEVPDDGTPIPVSIEILDDDTLSADDTADIKDGEGSILHLEIDPVTGYWSGDVVWPDSCTSGPDADICFQVSFDRDGDGLLDAWENGGINMDEDLDIEVALPGADPLHKDLYFEFDWEAGIVPRKDQIDEVRDAFADAPTSAGGLNNPDGQRGITIHIDAGSLQDSSGDFVGDAAFAGGDGSQISDGAWTFGSTCNGGLDAGTACSKDSDCDLSTPDDGDGSCEVGFYVAKSQFFDRDRALAFRYVIFNTGAGAGQGETGGNDIWLGTTASETMMHEMGHTLGLGHGGNPQEGRNCEPNYLSIMNYRYGRLQRLDGSTHIDFSPVRLRSGQLTTSPPAPLEEFDLDETVAIDAADQEHWALFVGAPEVCVPVCDGGSRDGDRCSPTNTCPSGTCQGLGSLGAACSADLQCGGGRCSGRDTGMSAIGLPIDWNQANPGETGVTQNIDGTFVAGICGNEGFAAEITQLPDSSLTGWDDWENIRLGFVEDGEAADAPNAEVPIEPPLGAWEAYAEQLNTTDLAIAKSGPAGPLEAGVSTRIAYTLDVSNEGPQPAGLAVALDVLPAGFTPTSATDPRCSEFSEGVLACEVETLLAGTQSSVAVEVSGVPSCEAGQGLAIVNTATVDNRSEFAGDDADTTDNSATHTIAVEDTTAPSVECNAPPTITPKDAPVSFTAAAVDACDAAAGAEVIASSCSLLSGSGKRVDKKESCVVFFEGDTLTIRDVGGVGTVIEWTVQTRDASGNTGEGTCSVEIERFRPS